MRDQQTKAGFVMYMVFAPLFVVMLLFASRYLVNNVDTWYRLKDTAVRVNAAVSSVKEVKDSDDTSDTDYKLYVTFMLNGMRHMNVYYKTVDSQPEEGFIGQAMQLYVDPQEPSTICPEPFDVGLSVVMFLLMHVITCTAMIILGAGLWADQRHEEIAKEVYSTAELS